MSFGLYVARRSPVHALPAWAKLLALAASGIAAFLIAEPVPLAAALAAALALFALARVPAAELWRQVRPALVLLAVIFLGHWVLTDARLGLITVLRFGVLILLATLVTCTTQVSAMIEAIERAAAPLRPLGVDPAKLGLTLSLAIRFIPLLAEQYRDIREAQAARGLDRDFTALVVPLLLRALRLADDLTDALDARGYDAAPDTRPTAAGHAGPGGADRQP